MAIIDLNNAPGAVPYVSMVDDQSNALLVNAINERTKKYEQQLQAIAENEALVNQMKFRDPDRTGAMVRAAKISSDLDKEINEKYGGDYGSIGARKAVANRIAQERGIFSTLQQKYEEEQPYKQLYSQLRASGQLAQKYDPTTGKVVDVNPFAQSVVDAEGNLIPQVSIDYGDIRKKGDYVDYISKNIVDPLNKRMKDLGLKYKSGPFAFTKTSIQGKQVGMNPEEAAATIDNNVAKRFLEENPTFAFEFGNDVEGAKNFIKDIVRQKAIQQTDYQYGNLTDQWGMYKQRKKDAEKEQPFSPSPFLPASKERGEVNPFVTERQQSGQTLQQLFKRSINRDYKDPQQVMKDFNTNISSLKKQQKELALKGARPEALAQLSDAINNLTQRKSTFLKYNNEVQERKTNWFNQAAQSITGNTEAKFKNLPKDMRDKILKQAPKSEQQWAKLFDDDLEGKTLTYRTQRTVEPELQKFIGSVTDLSGNYFRSSEGGTKSKNLDDIAEETGISVEALRQAIKTGQFPMTRIDATGEYAIRIPKDLKISKTGKLDYSDVNDKNGITLYHTFDEGTRQISEMLRWAESTRFETGKKQKTFNTAQGAITIEKTKQPNIFKVNGQPMTKESLEQGLLKSSEIYLSNTYNTYLQRRKLNQPDEEFMQE